MHSFCRQSCDIMMEMNWINKLICIHSQFSQTWNFVLLYISWQHECFISGLRVWQGRIPFTCQHETLSEAAAYPVFVLLLRIYNQRYSWLKHNEAAEITLRVLILKAASFRSSPRNVLPNRNFIRLGYTVPLTYPLPNCDDAIDEVWQWKSNFIRHFTEHMITYPFCD